MRTLFALLILVFSQSSFSKVKIYFEGEIDADSLASLEKKIVKEATRLKPTADRIIEVGLDSGGGDLLKTFAAVKRIRNLEAAYNIKIHTRVRSACESSCTVLFTAGSVRKAGKRARFGFHSPAIASRIPRGMSRTQIIEDARIRWISAVNEVDAQLAAELQRRGLLIQSGMIYISGKDLVHGYVTDLE